MFNFHIYSKIVFTFGIILLYIILRSIALPGILIHETVGIDYNTFVQVADFIAGNSVSNYSILALNITPTILSIALLQTYSIIRSRIYNAKKEVSYNILIGEMNTVFKYIFIVVSSLFSFLYLIYIDFYELSILKDYYILYLIHYLFCVVTLLVGSFIVLYLIQLINMFGLGKGFSFIILLNLVFTLYQMFNDYILKLSIGYLCVICMQCVLTGVLVYALDSYYIKIPIFEMLEQDFFKKNRHIFYYTEQGKYLVFSLSTLSIFPIIITESILFAMKTSIDCFSKLFFYTVVQIIIIFFIYTIANRLLKKPTRYIKHVHQNNHKISLFTRITDTYHIFSILNLRASFRELFFLISIIICSKIAFFILEISSFFMISNSSDLMNVYYYNNDFMLIYIICIRLLVYVFKKTDLTYIDTYKLSK